MEALTILDMQKLTRLYGNLVNTSDNRRSPPSRDNAGVLFGCSDASFVSGCAARMGFFHVLYSWLALVCCAFFVEPKSA